MSQPCALCSPRRRFAVFCDGLFVPVNAVFLHFAVGDFGKVQMAKNGTKCSRDHRWWLYTSSFIALPLGDDVVLAGIVRRLRERFFGF